MQEKIDKYILNVFKIGMVIRVFCLLGKILLARYNLTDLLISSIINIISNIMSVITTGIITYQIVIFFNKHHKNFLSQHRNLYILIQYIIVKIIFFALLINQKITSQFILYLNNLSLKNG